MRAHTAKEPPMRKVRESRQSGEPVVSENEPVHSQPVSSGDDLQARIAKRAYEIHAEQGYRYGCALDEWLEAEREILDRECNA